MSRFQGHQSTLTRLASEPAKWGVLVIAIALLVGCDRHDHEAVAPPAAHAPTTSTATGTLRGKAIFIGKAPTPRPIDNHACHPGAKPIVYESILVNPGDGGVRNVVVYLKDTPGDAAPATQPAVIDQEDCRYVPHVLAIPAGQMVTFTSSEPAGVAHNVHITSLGLNQSITGPGALPPVKFNQSGFLNVRCDAHTWMSCWLAVMDTPYFAVTNEKGEFEISNVPAGTYTITTWHERLPPLEQEVTVPPKGVGDVTLKYEQP
jgi:plastocyanin